MTTIKCTSNINDGIIKLPDNIPFKTLKRLVEILDKEDENQQDETLQKILGVEIVTCDNHISKKRRTNKDTTTEPSGQEDLLYRVCALEKQQKEVMDKQKEHLDRQQFLEKINEHVANQNFDSDGNRVKGDTFFGGYSLECFYSVFVNIDIELKCINSSPLQSIKHRQYMSLSDLVVELFGFLDRYMNYYDYGIDYGRAYEVRRFAIDELIRLEWVQKASSKEEESYIPQICLFPMKPMLFDEVEKHFSIPIRKRGMMSISKEQYDSEATYDNACKAIVMELYNDFYEKIFS